ncbi:MAG: phosphoadenosine phosphosulfate reductase family protein [Methanobrevibacter sp.]|nr:phosphoadenosine phosphosulfate reductase family protein [Methanobrevibacter sp.]
MNEIEKKSAKAIKLLQAVSRAKGGEVIEVAYSGGKDSDVILELTRMAGIPYRAIYKNTTIDPKGTLQHVREMGVEVRQPEMSFFELVKNKGLPNRHKRFCCSVLKEYKIFDTCIIGVRREESRKRAEIYKEPTICRVYNKNERVEQVAPILDWTLQDVAAFVCWRGLKLAPHYYTTTGEIDFTRRLGCVGCPLKSTAKRVQDFKENPAFLRAWLRALKVYFETHPQSAVVVINGGNFYQHFAWCLFPKNFVTNGTGLFDTDYKEALENLFKTNITI